MKFICDNELEIFEFHDVQANNISFEDNTLEMQLFHLNIHKKTVYNPADFDMEITQAIIKFNDCVVDSFEPDRSWKFDENGQLYTDDPKQIYTGEIARAYFSRNFEHGLIILFFKALVSNGMYKATMETIGEDPYFIVEFSFRSSEIQWDSYVNKAWYELHHQYKKEIRFLVDEKEQSIEALISCKDEDETVSGIRVKQTQVSIGVNLKNEEFWGHGHSTAEALKNLSAKMPNGVQLLTDDITI
jgi:hypothetical protein